LKVSYKLVQVLIKSNKAQNTKEFTIRYKVLAQNSILKGFL